MESSSNNRSADSRLLEAAAEGKTDLILQLLEEEGSKLHDHKDQVKMILTRVAIWPFSGPGNPDNDVILVSTVMSKM